MFTKLIAFIILTFGFYYLGEPLDMIIFGRASSSIYGSYAFLLTIPLLFVFAVMRNGLLYVFIYLGVPLLGIVFSIISYNILKSILMARDIFLSPVILKSTYCFYIYLICGVLAILYDVKWSRP